MQLTHNPFHIIGASSRDDRRRLLELSEEKSLLLDEGLVRGAAATLTNPRRRLAAELAWFPGLGPRRITELLSLLDSSAAEVREQEGLPTLAKLNLLTEGLARTIEDLSPEAAAAWIIELGEVFEGLDVESTVSVLNEERSVAGFPNVADLSHVESEIQERRRHFVRSIIEALDRLQSATLVSVVTLAVDRATKNGTTHAPLLIDDIVDSYEVRAQRFLEDERTKISILLDRTREAVKIEESESQVDRLVAELEKVVRNWDMVAQPIQISYRGRGRDHELSHQVADDIRALALKLFNEHSLLDASKRLTTLQQEVFAEVDRIAEQLQQDASALDEIAENHEQQLQEIKQELETWRREITYEADVGAMFKDKLRISPDGVEWKGRKIPLSEISRIRSGGTRHSVNGIPTGTSYKIFIASNRDSISVDLRRGQVFSNFVDRLWRAVGPRLITDMLEDLKKGGRRRFGTASVTDEGVELERHRIFGANERVFCRWGELVIGNGAGTFYLAKKDDKKVSAELSYQETDNVNVLETAIRVFWKKPGRKLSDLLNEAG